MKINFYISLLCYVILFNIMNPMFNYYYLIFTTYLLWVFSVATVHESGTARGFAAAPTFGRYWRGSGHRGEEAGRGSL